MRKFSRRTTIFMVAIGVLLTASIALAAATAVGSFTFQATTGGEPPVEPPQPLDVVVKGTQNVNLDREAPGVPLVLKFGNPEDNDPVTLGVVPEGGSDPEGAVTFQVKAPEGVDCDADDLLVAGLNDWDGELLEPGESHVDHFTLDLKPDANTECNGTTLEITVVVSGETVDDDDDDEDESAPVSGTSKV